MSLTLYSPKSLINNGTKVEVVAKFLGVPLEFNRIPMSEWKSPEYLKKHPLGKIPLLETPEGCIYESMSIIRYLARKAGKMYGSNPTETALIDQWLQFYNTQLSPYTRSIYIAAFGYYPITKDQYEESRKSVIEVLKVVDTHLASNEYLGFKEISVADVAIFCHLRYLYTLILDESARESIPHVTKWFIKLAEHPINKQFFGKTWLCQKQFVPDFEFSHKLLQIQKQQPKKEQVKKEQPKKEQVKKEQPKKKKEEEEEEEEEDPIVAAEKKKKNPLDDLPKSSFVLDDFKRDFVNAEDKKESLARFWANYDPVGWSLWKTDYTLDEGEGKVGYLTCNLKNGMLRNLDHFRKYTFSVLGVYGEEGDFVIKGAWLWRGTEIPEEWREHNSYDYFKFTKLDHTKEEDRKLIEEYWLNVDGGQAEGRPVFEAKWFK